MTQKTSIQESKHPADIAGRLKQRYEEAGFEYRGPFEHHSNRIEVAYNRTKGQIPYLFKHKAQEIAEEEGVAVIGVRWRPKYDKAIIHLQTPRKNPPQEQ